MENQKKAIENDKLVIKVKCAITSKEYDVNDPNIKIYYNNIHSSFPTGYVNKVESSGLYKKYFTEIHMKMNNNGTFGDIKIIKNVGVSPDELKKYFLAINNGKFIYVNSEILLDKKNLALFNSLYEEDIKTNIFYPRSANRAIEPFVCPDKLLGMDFSSMYDMSRDVTVPNTYSKTLGMKYSWGMEVETISGLVPLHVGAYIDFSSVHDGSLRHKDDDKAYGKEYVTGVSYGDKGLYNLRCMLNEINKRCILNSQCGNHIHIGTIPFDKLSIAYMYYFYTRIQAEVSQLLPQDRVNGKYTRFLPTLSHVDSIRLCSDSISDYDIDLMYTQVFKFASTMKPSNTMNRRKNHPGGKKCGFKLDSARYCWVNFVTALLNTRGTKVYTIEFRMPEGSFNYHNNKMWLLLCMAMVDYTVNHRQVFIDRIKTNQPITLEHVITTCYQSKGAEVLEFVNKRKENRIVVDYATKSEILKNITIKDL